MPRMVNTRGSATGEHGRALTPPSGRLAPVGEYWPSASEIFWNIDIGIEWNIMVWRSFGG